MNKSYMVTVWDSLTFETSTVTIELENPPSSAVALAHAVHEDICRMTGEEASGWRFCGVLGGDRCDHRGDLIEHSPATAHTAMPVKMAAVWQSVEVFAGGTTTLSAECFVELR